MSWRRLSLLSFGRRPIHNGITMLMRPQTHLTQSRYSCRTPCSRDRLRLGISGCRGESSINISLVSIPLRSIGCSDNRLHR